MHYGTFSQIKDHLILVIITLQCKDLYNTAYIFLELLQVLKTLLSDTFVLMSHILNSLGRIHAFYRNINFLVKREGLEDMKLH